MGTTRSTAGATTARIGGPNVVRVISSGGVMAKRNREDAKKEFFFLTCLAVKLSLAEKCSLPPNLNLSNPVLWERCCSQQIGFHKFHDFILAQLQPLFDVETPEDPSLLERFRQVFGT